MQLVCIWKFVRLVLKSLKKIMSCKISISGFWLFCGDVWKPVHTTSEVLSFTRFWKQTVRTFTEDVHQHI